MKKSFLTCSCLLIVACMMAMIATAQTQTGWVAAQTPGGADYALDKQGNSYRFGSFSTATITFGGTVLTNSSNSGTSDLFIVKFSPAGTVLWAKTASGPNGSERINSIAVNTQGEIFILGYSSREGLVLGNTTLNSGGIFLCKMDQDGSILWTKNSTDAPGGFSNTASIVVLDPNNNIIVGGKFYASTMLFDNYTFYPIVSGYNTFLAKFDPNGNVLWGRIASGDDTYGTTVDSSGNIYTVLTDNEPGIYIGSTSTEIITPFPNNYNIYTLKYDGSGNLLWGKTIGGNKDDYAFNIITDAGQNFYIAGFFTSDSIKFDGYKLTKNHPAQNMYLAKYNAAGVAQWVRTGVGRASATVICYKDTSIYLAGTFGGTTLTINSVVLTNHGDISPDDIFLAKYDTSGNFDWVRGEGNINSESPRSIAVTNDNYLLLGGYFGMPSIKLGTVTLTHPGPSGFAPFLAKLDQIPKPVVSNISSLCRTAGPASAKLLNPPVSPGFVINVSIDGTTLPYNATDSSITYYDGTLPAGQHTLLVKYSRGALSAETSTNFEVLQPVSPQVTIATADTTFTTGQLVTFIASPVNGGTTPTYQWQINNGNVGSNSDTFRVATLAGFDTVRVIMTSSLSCVTGNTDSSNAIVMNMVGRLSIQFANKAGSNYSLDHPELFLSARALEKRRRFNIPIDSTDLPVNERYIDSIRLAGNVVVLGVSKWLNSISIQTTDVNAINKINSFSFVKNMAGLAPRNTATGTTVNKFEEITAIPDNSEETPSTELANIYNYGQTYGQVHLHQGEFLHNHGFSGQGMQLAMMDAGFPNYNTLAVFDSVRLNNRFLGTWDFVNNNANVNGFNSHGTQCLSIIASHVPSTIVGTAPKTSFYLYRTEDAATEYPIEEQNMAVALERADSLGVDVASISLGYSEFTDPSLNYTYSDMDGNTSISAKAADLAARKGMLVVVAAGNEGAKPWHYLLTPSDADSVLSVGAVDISGNPGNFSSYGPSSDGQVKPGVAAMGVAAVVANPSTGTPMSGNGTSFACPNMAGLATCLWQAFPESINMGIISALQEAATIYNAPDDRIGYGIPDMKKAFVILLKRAYTQDIKQAGCNVSIKWTGKSSGNMNFVVERKLPTDADYLPIHTQNGSGDFANGSFSFSDDLSAFTPPISISYRIKMNIDTDTSFYFTPVVINHQNTCNTYTFTGDGNWNVAANWAGNNMPPANLPAGSTIIIDPVISGECILNTNQQIQAGGYIEVKAGKKMTVQGNLIIQ